MTLIRVCVALRVCVFVSKQYRLRIKQKNVKMKNFTRKLIKEEEEVETNRCGGKGVKI